VVKNAQTHAVPVGKALHEARVYRTTERWWLWFKTIAGWWFGTFFIFHNIWDNPSH